MRFLGVGAVDAFASDHATCIFIAFNLVVKNDSKIGSRIEARIHVGLFAAGGPCVACWSHGVVLDASSSESVEDDRSKTSLWVAAVAVAILSESHFVLSELRETSALASLKWLGEPIICHMVLDLVEF